MLVFNANKLVILLNTTETKCHWYAVPKVRPNAIGMRFRSKYTFLKMRSGRVAGDWVRTACVVMSFFSIGLWIKSNLLHL